ncbi:hypothetical protein VTL71DRAFT_5322 [Oculimacula yallundae]|uniref:Uncharacterized protein n=1 Tax=Oculimacula yallundae TaxID=86028 RepID=A0ABR4C0V1_9HELO
MSSAPQSAPETPSKSVAATKLRTPLPGGPTNGVHKMTMPPKESKHEASKGETQEPSSTPIPEAESAPVSKPGEVDSQSRQENEHSSDEEEEEEESHLSDFDWSDWELRYTDTLKDHYKEELHIIEEFEAYAMSFTVWARAGAERDNARMSKRLKTRKEFTHLAEQSLEDKANHYKGVVDAFQAAMNMLRRQ